jgi:hypothetical protein
LLRIKGNSAFHLYALLQIGAMFGRTIVLRTLCRERQDENENAQKNDCKAAQGEKVCAS